MGWWKTLEAERADVEKSGADELILLEQTDEWKKAKRLWHKTRKLRRDLEAQKQKEDGMAKATFLIYSAFVIKWDIHHQDETMHAGVKWKHIHYTVNCRDLTLERPGQSQTYFCLL